MITIAHSWVGREPVGQDCRAIDRIVGHEPLQRRRGVVFDRRQPDPAGFAARQGLDRGGDQYLALGAATLPASDGIVLGPVDNTALVDLDHSFERTALRVDHRSAQLVQQKPSGLVGADAELRLKLQRGDAVRVRRDQMRRQKPRAQRQVGPVHHGAGSRRGLPTAAGTFPRPRLGFELPALQAAASGTREAVRPTAMRQPFGARCIVRERRHEMLQRRRPVMLPAVGLVARRHYRRVAWQGGASDRNHKI